MKNLSLNLKYTSFILALIISVFSLNFHKAQAVFVDSTADVSYVVAALPPSAPTNVAASSGSCGTSTVNVSWTASAGATSYNVLRSTSSNGTYTQIGTNVNATSYSDSDPALNEGSTYYYLVRANNAAGTSGDSNKDSAVVPNDCVAPAPATVSADSGSCGTGAINVYWAASAGATSYNVVRSTSSGGPYSTTVASNVSGLSYTNYGLTAPPNTYYYKVQSNNSGGTSANSVDNGSAPVPSSCSGVTSVPTLGNPTATSIGTTTATLGATVTSLGVPATITARGTCYGFTPFPTTNCSPATLSQAVSPTAGATFTQVRSGLSNNKTYYFRGYATNSTGTGYSSDGMFSTATGGGSSAPSCGSIKNTCVGAGSTYNGDGSETSGASPKPYQYTWTCSLVASQCSVPVEQCKDGVDNDGDTLIDFGGGASNDPGCSSANDNNEKNIKTTVIEQ